MKEHLQSLHIFFLRQLVDSLEHEVPLLNQWPRKEVEEQQCPEAWQSKTLQDDQRKVGDIAAQRAFAHQGLGAEGETFQVGRVSIGDGRLISRLVDDVGNEKGEHDEEDQDEEEQSNIWHNDLAQLLQSNGDHDQLDEADAEEDQPHKKEYSHRNKEEGQNPCVVVLLCYETAKRETLDRTRKRGG